MSKKDKIIITRTEDFSEIETELATAMEQLDETNTRIESLLQAHAKPETETVNIPDPGFAEITSEQNA